MKKSRKSSNPAVTVLLVIGIFVAVLAGSIMFQLFSSSDFSGFGKAPKAGEPVVTYLPDKNAGEGGSASYDWQDHPVFIIGDSLTQGARSYISDAVPGASIDAKVGRTMSEGLKILRDWDAAGILTDDAIIVVCLAHNITDGSIRDAEQVVNMIRPGQSLIMMTGHGLNSMKPVNEYIRGLHNQYSYITIADWDLTIVQSPSLLSDDGIHISKKQGNEIYAKLILRALEVAKPMP